MAIHQTELERIKREVSLVRLVEGAGVELTGQGDNLTGLCPFHDDKHLSLVISPSKNVWHCPGACQGEGTVIDWVMRKQRVSFRLAFEMLKNDAPSLVASGLPKREHARLEEIAEPEEPDAVVLRRVVGYYHETLKDSPEALAYLAARGLHHRELVDHFLLGYSNRTLGYRLPPRRLKSGGALRTQLQRVGIYRESGHERYRGAMVIPVLSEDGRLRELYGRRIGTASPGTPVHLYLPAHEGGRGVFNIAALKASKEIIVCEALLDALSFWVLGFRNVTSAYGVTGFGAEMHEAFAEHGVKKVLIAYDRDEAGDRAAEKLATELAKQGMEVFRVLFPRGTDVNEQLVKMGGEASKAFEALLRNAEWMAGTRAVAVTAKLAAGAPYDPITGEVAAPGVDAGTSESSPTRAAERVLSVSRILLDVHDQEVRTMIGDRRWRIRGLAKNTSYESLRVNLMVSRGEDFYVDLLELYNKRQRLDYLSTAAAELGVDELALKSDLGRIVLALEDLVHQQIQQALKVTEPVAMSDEDRREALALLRDPRLLDRILEDLDRMGIVGEETNKLVAYLAAVSRKLDKPLAVMIQSPSAAGKSTLADAVLRLMPEEEVVSYSALTGQSLFYMGEHDLERKILAIAEEEGAERASYALKILQSEGKISIASTGKDPATGRLVSNEYVVRGPVMILLTTTSTDMDPELQNRCLVLAVDDGPEQTAAIHRRQREAQTLEGLLAREDRDAIEHIHQNAQRLLEPLKVAWPKELTTSLSFSSRTTRARRDHTKYLNLIASVALLFQHQRPIKERSHRGKVLRYVEVTEADIAIAGRLAKDVLKNCLDELPPQTRRLLGAIERFVAARGDAQGVDASTVRFTRRQIREHTGLSHTQVRIHLGRLEELEYLFVHAGGGKRRTVYELALEAPDAGEAAARIKYDSRLKGSWRGVEGGPPLQDLSNASAGKSPLEGVSQETLKAEEPPKNGTSSYSKKPSSKRQDRGHREDS